MHLRLSWLDLSCLIVVQVKSQSDKKINKNEQELSKKKKQQRENIVECQSDQQIKYK
jgi:hypothetical protein